MAIEQKFPLIHRFHSERDVEARASRVPCTLDGRRLNLLQTEMAPDQAWSLPEGSLFSAVNHASATLSGPRGHMQTPSWLRRTTTSRQAHEYDSAQSPLYLGNLLQVGIALDSLCLYQQRTSRQAHEYDSQP